MLGTDPALEPGEENGEVRADCLNNEARICQFLRSTRHFSDRRAQAEGNLREGEACMRALVERTSFTAPPTKPQQIVADLKLGVPLTEVISPKVVPQFAHMVDLWQRIEDTRDRFAGLVGDKYDNIALQVGEMVRDDLKASNLGMMNLHGSAFHALQWLYEFEQVPSCEAVQEATNRALEHMETQLKDSERLLGQEQLSEQEVQECEEQLALRSEMIDEVWKQMGELKTLRSSITQHEECRRDAVERVLKEIPPLQEAKTRLLAKAAMDLRVIEDEIAKQEFARDQADLRHRAVLEGNDRTLRENAMEQEECWRCLQEIEGNLQTLGERRYEAVERRIEAVTQEAKRKASFDSQLRAMEDHKRILINTMRNCEMANNACERSIGIVRELVAVNRQVYNRRVQELGDVEVEVYKRALKCYRSHCLLLPILIDFNERNLERIYRAMSEGYQFTYLYRERRRENEKDLQLLMKEQREEYERFKPIGGLLLDAGVNFVNPMEEIPPVDSERLDRLMRYRKQFSEQGEDDIDEAKRASEAAYKGTPLSKGETTRVPELYFSLQNPYSRPKDTRLADGELDNSYMEPPQQGRASGIRSPNSSSNSHQRQISRGFARDLRSTPTAPAPQDPEEEELLSMIDLDAREMNRKAEANQYRATSPSPRTPSSSGTNPLRPCPPSHPSGGRPVSPTSPTSNGRPCSPLDRRPPSPGRKEDHPAIARRSGLASRPIEDKRPGAHALEQAERPSRECMGLRSLDTYPL